MHQQRVSEDGCVPKRSERVYNLEFSEDFERFGNEFFCLELSESQYQVLKSEMLFKIVGDENSTPVLCTEKQTFALKTVETSNNLLVVDNTFHATQTPQGSSRPHQVLGIEHSKLQMFETKPSEQKLRDILGAYPYQGPQYEPKYRNDVLSLEQLSEHMQCSNSQLLDLLFGMPDATSLDGYWRVVDEHYLAKCVVQICNLVDENQWDPEALPNDDIREILSSLYSRGIIDLALEVCCHVKSETDPYSLSEKKVARFYAIYILHDAKRMVLSEFYSTWQNLLPLGFEATSDHLKGVALEDEENNTITYFPKSSLSRNMADRFKQIFSMSEKWRKSQLDPYIKEILDKNQTLDQIYSQYCHKHTQNDEIYYTLKPVHNFIF
ncbi:Sister chromatid cohesion protein DCC1 [Thelohanellus kitauei]|uniref:Sister chromatid cohesion protein DCC1 n=1 Tax=Thelohanellus kitauei TaxID=669202 RepID=A0A0C2MCL1_THEKT|nr:Sister chromatid cohesion protein DCC1 [Thelohanellus kitauei]